MEGWPGPSTALGSALSSPTKLRIPLKSQHVCFASGASGLWAVTLDQEDTKAETRRLPEKAEPAVGLKKLKMRPQVPPPGVAINPFPPSSLQTMSSLKGKNPQMHFLLKC